MSGCYMAPVTRMVSPALPYRTRFRGLWGVQTLGEAHGLGYAMLARLFTWEGQGIWIVFFASLNNVTKNGR
jgi:hypothetical protein